jgi:hypothetical protein
MTHPAHSSRIHREIIIWCKAQTLKIVSIQPPPLSFYLVPLRSRHPPQHHILKDPASA